jgi:peptidoglycan/LPS O-acetylase OafA/YrhL
LPPSPFGRDELLTIVLRWNTRLGRRNRTLMSDTLIDDAIAGGRAMPSAPPLPYRRQTYRPDIDGLRAIAVLGVVAFHFNVGPVPGGFTGVDIFFVISGYLITGNILDNLRAGSFTFSDFYQRRIRRIFPALLVVLLFTFVTALTVRRDDELFSVLRPFGATYHGIVAGAAFVTNFTLLHGSNYFTQTGTTQPLLHLWSLAIEEQFYIVWPLFLFGLFRLKLVSLPFVLAIAAVSFGFNVLTVQSSPELAFYSPQARAWELMLGAALACVGEGVLWPRAAHARSAIGMASIMVGLFALTRNSTFPGWAALLPALGAVLVISAGPNALLNRYVLGTRPAVAVGLASYSLYLWHWPALLLFEKYAAPFATGSPQRQLLKAAVLLFCAGATWLTFRFVETPFRFGPWRRPRHAGLLLLAMLAVGLAAAATPTIVLHTAVLSPYQRETMPLLRRVANRSDFVAMFGQRSCFSYLAGESAAVFTQNKCLDLKYPGAKTVLLTGDSHAGSLALGLGPVLEGFNVNFLQLSAGGCEPIVTDESTQRCKEINDLVAQSIAAVKPDIVIVDTWWTDAMKPPAFLGGDFNAVLSAKLNDLLQRGAKAIILVGEIPVWFPSLPENLARNFVQSDRPIPQRTFVGLDQASLAVDTLMKSFHYPTGVTYLSMRDVLCDAAGCLTAVGPDLEHDIVVWDYSHLTPAAARYVAHVLIEPRLAEILARRASP